MQLVDPDEKCIHDALSQIKVQTGGLNEKVLKRLHEGNPSKLVFKKPVRPVIVAAILCTVFALTVAAAEIGGFEWFIKCFNPAFGDIVEPVDLYAQDQGIRMAIIGAQKYENQAVVYLSLQDITGQNRITEQTDFKDGFGVKCAMPKSNNNSETDELASSLSWRQTVLYFDEHTNTLYLELNISGDSNTPFLDPLTLSSFLIYFNQTDYEKEPIDIALSNLLKEQTIEVRRDNIIGGRGDYPEKEPYDVLAPGYFSLMPHQKADQWISNIGYSDGLLQVQIGNAWQKEFGSSGATLYLLHSNGTVIEEDYAISILIDNDSNVLSLEEDAYALASQKLTESIFTVPEEELDDYTLCFSGSYSTGATGNWEVTANTGDISKQIRTWQNTAWVDAHLFEYLYLTPLGLQVIGSYTGLDCTASDMEIAVETTNGTVLLEGGSGSIDIKRKSFNHYWRTDLPLDTQNATALIINGVTIPIE